VIKFGFKNAKFEISGDFDVEFDGNIVVDLDNRMAHQVKFEGGLIRRLSEDPELVKLAEALSNGVQPPSDYVLCYHGPESFTSNLLEDGMSMFDTGGPRWEALNVTHQYTEKDDVVPKFARAWLFYSQSNNNSSQQGFFRVGHQKTHVLAAAWLMDTAE